MPPVTIDGVEPVMGDVPALGQHTGAILDELDSAVTAHAPGLRRVLSNGDIIDRNILRSGRDWYLIDFEFAHLHLPRNQLRQEQVAGLAEKFILIKEINRQDPNRFNQFAKVPLHRKIRNNGLNSRYRLAAKFRLPSRPLPQPLKVILKLEHLESKIMRVYIGFASNDCHM